MCFRVTQVPRYWDMAILILTAKHRQRGYCNLLGQRSKTRTKVADPGSAPGGTFQCMQFLLFFIYLFYLGHLSLLGLQRKSISSTFFSFKSYNPETFISSTATAFVNATRKHSQKVPCTKVACTHSRYTWHKGIVVMLSPAQWCSRCAAVASLCLYDTYLSYLIDCHSVLCWCSGQCKQGVVLKLHSSG